ncbi:NUDIX hydrolase [Pseudaminobacter arsenicus]|uniref:NUDIX hydrolase n=1 Tax=Borborobacter arsenicus TaxID=1851146 RepID=A0A432V2W5_9HYPH|nr:NUDIX hydrolase [Pseudaminobacter arsenicus]RUM96553.1 NUDIX hydrolase [Pseudaminobacter arsenicus]
MERLNERAFSSKAMQFLQAPPAPRRTALPVVPDSAFAAAFPARDRMASAWAGIPIPARRGARMTDIPFAAEDVLQVRNPGFGVQEVGALPWRIGRDKRLEILLVASRQRSRWTLPQGLPAMGRTAVRSAALRAFEQVGIIGQTHPVAVGDYSYVRPGSDGRMRQCRVTVFSLHVKGTLISWQERKRLKRRWFGLHAAAQMVAERELASILEKFVPHAWSSRPDLNTGFATVASAKKDANATDRSGEAGL